MVELLREVMPYSLAVFSPPDWDREYTRCYGFELEDIFAFGMRSVRTKWRAIGYPIEEMPRRLPVRPRARRPRRSRERQIKLLKAGVLGEPERPARLLARDPAALLRRRRRGRADTERRQRRPLTIQWRFSDAEPWHMRIDNGSTAAEPGAGPRRPT